MTYREAKQIKERHKKGIMPTDHEQAIIPSAWLRLYGTGGCDCYPYIGFWDMLDDIISYYEGGQK
jgi:hypothetical protein